MNAIENRQLHSPAIESRALHSRTNQWIELRNHVMTNKLTTLATALWVTTHLLLPTTSAATEINPEVAKAYNDGVVRCGNAECAKYLYACFRTYSSTSLQEFMVCGTQASRLNRDQVVLTPTG